MICRLAVAWVVAAGAVGVGARLDASSPQRGLEYDVKAAYLYNFLGYIEWPALPPVGQPFRICVVGRNPFGSALVSVIQGQQVRGRELTVDSVRTVREAASCQVLFAPRGEESRLGRLLRSAESRGVLAVGETPEALRQCGAIAFVLDGERVRFDVDLQALAAQGLKARANLLRVARQTFDGPSRCP